MKKLILLLIIATAFASGIRAQGTEKTFLVTAHGEWREYSDSRGFINPPEPDTINYLVIFRDTTKDVNGQVIYPVSLSQKIVGFKTQTTLGSFLNERVDSTNLISVFDVRTKKPLKASFSVEDKVVERVVAERVRNRKWNVK